MRDRRPDMAWSLPRGGEAIDPVMRFSQEGLVFGAGTLLAKSRGGDRNVSIDPLDPRLHALLAAAHLRRPSARALAHLRKAAERWNEGDDALAAMHLTLSGLDRLAEPETDAHRLFLADGLLNGGVEAAAVIGAIEAGGTALDGLRKFDPDQPRVPAGSGRTSGEWTSSGDSPAASPASEPEVNPNTITQVSGPVKSIYACTHAQAECVTVALELSERLDPANDNWPAADIKKCRDAGFACDFLSWVIEDIPFIDYGGVIFPHKGVIIMRKGQLDTYYPPLPGGKPPNFRTHL